MATIHTLKVPAKRMTSRLTATMILYCQRTINSRQYRIVKQRSTRDTASRTNFLSPFMVLSLLYRRAIPLKRAVCFAIQDRRNALCPFNLHNNVKVGVCVHIGLSLIHISEPTRLGMISYAVFCLKK